MRKIKNRAQRIDTINGFLNDVKKKQTAGTKKVMLRGKPEYLRIISVPIDFLMFRLDNARTRRQQLGYLKNHPDVPKHLFSDPETLNAQLAQEAILLDMISSSKDFVTDLIDRGQEDPAIITYDGYIVNGNRRTAALRSIGAQYVDCVVLPENISKKEIYDLELDLQISEDFKEDYHWINELIDIEQGIKDKAIDETEEEMARRLHIDSQKLKAKLRMKFLVDSFLAWKGQEGEYDYEKLDEAEQDFIELEKETKKARFKNNPALSDQAQKAVFTLIDEKPKAGRSYAIIRDLFRNFDQVYESLKKRTVNPTPTAVLKTSKKHKVLDALADEDEYSEQIVDVFGKPNSKEISKMSLVLQEIIMDVKAENSEKKDSEAVYDSVSEALRQMQGLSINKNTSKVEEIYNKLEELIKVSSSFLNQVKKYRKN